jgi:citronellol/citronellal dehydrogenase
MLFIYFIIFSFSVAKDGANVALAAKTADPHPKLPGTIFSVAKEVEQLGGKGIFCQRKEKKKMRIKWHKQHNK